MILPRPFPLLAGLFLALGWAASGASQTLFRARPQPRVPAYRVTWELSYDEEIGDPAQPFFTYRYRGSNVGSAEIPLFGSSVAQTVYKGQGTCSGDAFFSLTIHTPEGDIVQDSDCSGQNAPSTYEAFLSLNADGTYDFTPAVPIFNGVGHAGGMTLPATRNPEVAPVIKAPQGQDPVITFDGTLLKEILPGRSLSIHLRATIAPVGPPPKLLLKQTALVTPEVGTNIAGVVTQVGSGGSPVPIRFFLEEVTKEPGQCLNGPDTGDTPDLDFFALGNTGLFKPPIPTGSGWSLETLQPRTSATCQIGVRDYGAWGKLRAEAYYQGSWHAVPVEKSKVPYTTVPLDVNLNKIADKWEKDNRLKSSASTADLEMLPKGDGKTSGDGFSNYEEYRGLFAKGKHVRFNPNLKDLVIANEVGATAERGLALFKSASGFGVITVDAGELPGSRVVNEHHGLFHGGDQRGLRLVQQSIGGGVVGEAVPATVLNKRPKDCTLIRVDPSPIQSAPPPAGFEAEFAATIAHEIAHAIGVEHHGNRVDVTVNRDVITNDSHVRLFGADGVEITRRPFFIEGPLGGPHTEASGDVNCVMCYTSRYQWCVIPPTGPDFTLYAAQPPVTGTTFCASAKGTGMNAKGKYFGDAARGNCLAQMRVKDY